MHQHNILSAFKIIIDAQPDMHVVGTATNGSEAIHAARRLRPDVVLTDIRMPLADGLEVTKQLAGPNVADPMRVVVVTTYDTDEYVRTALRLARADFFSSGPVRRCWSKPSARPRQATPSSALK